MKTKRNAKVHFNSSCTSEQTNLYSLKEVLSEILILFKEYADKHNLSDYERSKFENILYEYYLQERAKDYLQEHVSSINSYINKLLYNTFSNVFTEDKGDLYETFYYNKKHHLMPNE